MIKTITSFFKPAAPVASPAAPAAPALPDLPALQHRRFLSDNPFAYKKAVEAAAAYVAILEDDGDKWWLYSKPFDQRQHNQQYYRLMYDVLNILQAMDVAPRGRILEIGSGPGWITEILLMLGFSVDALEPAADMVDVARERTTGLAAHYRQPSPPDVRFHTTTLEDIALEDGAFDAVLYFDSLHHIHDEHAAIEKSFRYLKPGGVVGVVEAAWHPDFKELEAGLMAEMEHYGTLENPFSIEYLDALLERAGFVEIQRYSGVNGYFTAPQLAQPMQHFSAPIIGSNNITARKPSLAEMQFPPCTRMDCATAARISVTAGGMRPDGRQAAVEALLENTGETLFSNRPARAGYVTLALRRGVPSTEGFLECRERHPLPATLAPGESASVRLLFTLPADAPLDGWELDAVAEGAYWFSSLGIASGTLP